MAGMCCGVVGDTETTVPVEPSSKRRIIEIHKFSFVAVDVVEVGRKRLKADAIVPVTSSPPRQFEFPVQNCEMNDQQPKDDSGSEANDVNGCVSQVYVVKDVTESPVVEFSKFGITSVCGKRRDMEDAVSVIPSFSCANSTIQRVMHFFGVYDGHGCSHVAMKCKDRMHEIVKEEIEIQSQISWKDTMMQSFLRMDKEVTDWCNGAGTNISNCRCELRTPQCDAVGSTAVVAVVTQGKIVVSNCGDSRAVLCRNGVAIPLSIDHKPDRPDELLRIQDAGGRVIYWDGARVLGVLAMSRAIGDNYLKPYVISEPEVTITDRTPEDECLILASDGLWDVVSNDTACSVARICLQARKPRSPGNEVRKSAVGESSDKACSDASMLLTKLALARHSTDNVSVVVVDLRRDL